MADTLIVYYSQSGHCEEIARTLSQKIGADVEWIRPVKPYKGKFPLRGLLDAFGKKSPAITPEKLDCAGYEKAILILPIWADGFPPPVRTYLSRNASKIRSLYTVCASGSSGDEGVIKMIGEEFHLQITGNLVIHNSDLADKSFAQKLEGFAAKL